MLNSKKDILFSGILKNNPVFRLVLGMCPVLAVTVSASNGIGMGLSTMFVLICSNVLISALRNVIPDKVRIPAYIMIVATFVTLVEMVLRKFVPNLYDSLGVYIPLIVVNCIILGRAEAFANQNKVFDSMLDGISMGAGFTLSLVAISIVRELLGAGKFFGISIFGANFPSLAVIVQPAGGFLMLGLLMAAFNFIYKAAASKKKKEA